MKKPIIQIASRRVAESIAQLAREQGKAVGFLSIRSTDEDIPDLSTPGSHALYLQFDDVDDENVTGCTPMDETQAQLIADFIDEFCNTNVTSLVVTCTAGISRSAGVAAALHEALGCMRRWAGRYATPTRATSLPTASSHPTCAATA